MLQMIEILLDSEFDLSEAAESSDDSSIDLDDLVEEKRTKLNTPKSAEAINALHRPKLTLRKPRSVADLGATEEDPDEGYFITAKSRP